MYELPRQRLSIWWVYALMVILAILASIYLYSREKQVALEEVSAEMQRHLTIRKEQLEDELESARLAVRFLYSTPPISGIVRATENGGIDPYDGTELSYWNQRLETIFTAFLENYPAVYQARIIGVEDGGRELVRVERSHGNIQVVSSGRLQQKAESSYFKNISGLPPDRIFLSDFNLNREHGEIVYPIEPTFRAGIPVYNDEQELFGMLVINLDARPLMQSLQESLPDNLELYLLNQHGGFIIHPDDSLSFLYELDDAIRWNQYYELRTDINKKEIAGLDEYRSLTGDSNLYVKNYPVLLGKNLDRSLGLYVGLNQDTFNQMLFSRNVRSFVVMGGVLVAVMVFLMVYQSNVSKTLRLREAQGSFEAIIDGSADAIIGMDLQGRITSWNTSAHEMFGFTERQVGGQSLTQLIPDGGDMVRFENAFDQVLHGEYLEPEVFHVRRRNGSLLTVSMSISPVKTASEQPLGAAAILRDISDQVAAEKRIAEVNESLEKQVSERTSQLETATREAETASLAKSSFVANVSHEMRTPLNGILGMFRMIRQANSDEQRRRYLAMAESSARTLASLINDVLDLSKIEAGKLDVEIRTYNIIEIFSEVVTSMAIPASEKGVELVLEASSVESPWVRGDSARLRQILTNLIGNAIKFTSAGWIKVSASTANLPDGYTVLSCTVEDTGIGIASDKLDSIFDAFSQEDDSVTREYGGTGLGLSITRQLCEFMGGNIEVSSEKGKGSLFSFSLHQRTDQENRESYYELRLTNQRYLLAIDVGPIAVALKKWLYRCGASQVDSVSLSEVQDRVRSADSYDLIFVDEAQISDALDTDCPVVRLSHQWKKAVGNLSTDQPVFVLPKPVTPESVFQLFENIRQAGTDIGYAIGQPQEPENDSVSDTAGGIPAGAYRVLVVDDNEINRVVVEGMLEDQNLVVDFATDGEEAINKMLSTEQPFDLVLMDCQMPVKDGYTATQEIRSGNAGAAALSVPVIAMTANAMAGDRERCLAAGMDDYLTKPLDVDELESKLTRWLSKSKKDIDREMPAGAFQQLSVWDPGVLLKRVGGKPERIKELLKVFLSVSPERIRKMRDAMVSGDIAQAMAMAHELKGTTGSIAALRMQALVAHFETVAKQGEKSSLQSGVGQLDQAYGELVAVLQEASALDSASAG